MTDLLHQQAALALTNSKNILNSNESPATATTTNSTLQDYLALMKPRVVSLNVFTAIVGLLIAPGHIHPFLFFVAILCIAVGAGAAAVINMWYEADIDKIMYRTRNRPIVCGKIAKNDALAFGIILAFFSTLMMAICINYVSSVLLLFTIFFYGVIYTMLLKRRTIYNIVIGGAAGALPPVIGYSAVTNSVDATSCLLFLIIFLWTPAHFWALSLYCANDYKLAQVPVMSNVKGVDYTKYNILLYTILTVIVAVVPYFLSIAGMLYLICSTISGGVFVWFSLLLFNDPSCVRALRMFKYSIIYIFTIYMYLLVDFLL